MAARGVRSVSLALIAALSLGWAADAEARPKPRPRPGRSGPTALPIAEKPMETGRAIRPIPAWKEFCAKDPGSCSISADEPERMVLTLKAWRLMDAVNRYVNKTITPMTDLDHWGKVDVWGYPDDGIGDCEDFQLLKRRMLERAGLPRRAMRMTVVVDERNEGHAVLTVLTDRGDFILDNKAADILLPMHPSATPYAYVKREGAEPGPDGGAWVALDEEATAVATAANGAR